MRLFALTLHGRTEARLYLGMIGAARPWHWRPSSGAHAAQECARRAVSAIQPAAPRTRPAPAAARRVPNKLYGPSAGLTCAALRGPARGVRGRGVSVAAPAAAGVRGSLVAPWPSPGSRARDIPRTKFAYMWAMPAVPSRGMPSLHTRPPGRVACGVAAARGGCCPYEDFRGRPSVMLS